MSAYAKILFFAAIIPFVLSFYPNLHFYRKPKALVLSIGSVIFIFGIWDVIATHYGHWWFVVDKVSILYWLGLPLEEWLFFAIIPFCCLFTWEVVNYFWSK